MSDPIVIDVSHWQGNINWPKLAQAGVVAAFIKATNGAFQTDSQYSHNVQGARAAGIKVGSYHFMLSSQDPDLQAEKFLATASGVQDLLPALDCEWDFKGKHDRWLDIPQEARIAMIGLYVAHIKKALGVNPIIYCVSADTMILTGDLRWTPAGDLRVGDPLLAFDDEPEDTFRSNRYFQDAVVTENSVISAPVIRIDLDNGETLFATPEHRWLVRRNNDSGNTIEWIKTSRLRVGDQMPKYAELWTEQRGYDDGFLSAAFDGEGCISDRGSNGWPRPNFMQKENALLERVCTILRRKGIKFQDYPRENDKCHSIYLQSDRQKFFEFLGMFRPPRLMDKWCEIDKSKHRFQCVSKPKVVSIEPAGNKEIAVLSSSSGTYIAEGYAAHNTATSWWRPMLGTATNYSGSKGSANFGECPLWIAAYTKTAPKILPAPWTNWSIWQYTGAGKLPGVAGTVDIDKLSGTLDSIMMPH